MASGSGSGDNEGPTPLTLTSDDRMTAILEQLVRSHEVQVSMQAQIASLLQV